MASEDASVALAIDTRRAAIFVGEPKLNPPRCAIGQLIGDENNARGALPPSAAKSSLTRDARAKARRQRQAMLSSLPFALAVR